MRVLWSGPGEPAFNMALDEALLRSDSPLTLRFYQWEPHALSLGRFQKLAEGEPHEHVLVRRLTGGGAILHAEELTYSLTGPDGEGPFAGDVSASYRVVHDALIDVLRGIGVDIAYAGDDAPPALRRSDQPFLCFARSTSLDLVAPDGTKLVGSAKRRVAGRALQHGSIVVPDVDLRAVAVELAAALGGEEPWGAPTPDETSSAEELVVRYRDTTWTRQGDRLP